MDNAADTTFEVAVVYATPTQQQVTTVSVLEGCTALQAVQLAGMSEVFPDMDGSTLRLGIFGHLVNPDHLLTAGDRVEIYRPLQIDPKESRRQRAQTAKHQRSKAP